MTKTEARDEVLRRWHALPAEDRHNVEDAQVWAAAYAEELDFRTMGNARKVIAAWLVQDLGGAIFEDEDGEDSAVEADEAENTVNGPLRGSDEAYRTS
jgi:hypothetical protein